MGFREGMLLLTLILQGMLQRLITTELLECAASLLFPKRNRYDLILVLLVNLATNPAAVFLDFLFRDRFFSPVLWVIMLEGAVWLLEAVIYKFCLHQKTNPFLYSFVLNGISYGVGFLLQL